ncbi:hypothetical protein HanRHA438_Chr04g0185241 [Helianthus annuus]|nr:hypothetical protein HanRHA438_Chr04g0185241 [Helianthus annuus]
MNSKVSIITFFPYFEDMQIATLIKFRQSSSSPSNHQYLTWKPTIRYSVLRPKLWSKVSLKWRISDTCLFCNLGVVWVDSVWPESL